MKAEVALTVESTTVHVGLSERSYDIHIGLNNLSTIGELAGELGDISHVVVITDSNVRDLYGETVLKSLSQNDFQPSHNPLVFQRLSMVHALDKQLFDDPSF